MSDTVTRRTFLAGGLTAAVGLLPGRLLAAPPTTVTTAADLEAALKRGDREIVITGKLAADLRAQRQTEEMAGSAAFWCMVAGGVGIVAAPFTGGASLGVTAAAGGGLTVGTAVVLIVLGVVAMAILKNDYDEIEFSAVPPRMVLRRKARR